MRANTVNHTFDTRIIAQKIRAAQDEVRQIAPLTSQWSDFDTDSAYEVAAMIHRTRVEEGVTPVGRKIGFTNPKAWPVFGAHEPMWAYVYDTTVVRLAAGRGKCSVGRLAEPRIEPEIVIHFRSAPPVTDDLSEILTCADWIAHGFEIVQSHFPGWKLQAADAIADSGLHGTLLIGEPRDLNDFGADLISVLERFEVRLACNGEVREVGKASNVLGSPLKAIARLLSLTAERGPATMVQANELVTTGSLTAALPIHAGETWSTELSGLTLPGLSVEFVDSL